MILQRKVLKVVFLKLQLVGIVLSTSKNPPWSRQQQVDLLLQRGDSMTVWQGDACSKDGNAVFSYLTSALSHARSRSRYRAKLVTTRRVQERILSQTLSHGRRVKRNYLLRFLISLFWSGSSSFHLVWSRSSWVDSLTSYLSDSLKQLNRI